MSQAHARPQKNNNPEDSGFLEPLPLQGKKLIEAQKLLAKVNQNKSLAEGLSRAEALAGIPQNKTARKTAEKIATRTDLDFNPSSQDGLAKAIAAFIRLLGKDNKSPGQAKGPSTAPELSIEDLLQQDQLEMAQSTLDETNQEINFLDVTDEDTADSLYAKYARAQEILHGLPNLITGEAAVTDKVFIQEVESALARIRDAYLPNIEGALETRDPLWIKLKTYALTEKDGEGDIMKNLQGTNAIIAKDSHPLLVAAAQKQAEELRLNLQDRKLLALAQKGQRLNTEIPNDFEEVLKDSELSQYATVEAWFAMVEQADDWDWDGDLEEAKIKKTWKHIETREAKLAEALAATPEDQRHLPGFQALQNHFLALTKNLAEVRLNIGSKYDSYSEYRQKEGSNKGFESLFKVVDHMSFDKGFPYAKKLMLDIEGDWFPSSTQKQFNQNIAQSLFNRLAGKKKKELLSIDPKTQPKEYQKSVEDMIDLAMFFSERDPEGFDESNILVEGIAEALGSSINWEEKALVLFKKPNPIAEAVEKEKNDALAFIQSRPAHEQAFLAGYKENIVKPTDDIQVQGMQLAAIRFLQKMKAFRQERGEAPISQGEIEKLMNEWNIASNKEVQAVLAPFVVEVHESMATFFDSGGGSAESIKERMNDFTKKTGVSFADFEEKAVLLMAEISGWGGSWINPFEMNISDQTWHEIAAYSKIAAKVAVAIAVGLATMGAGWGVMAAAGAAAAASAASTAAIDQTGVEDLEGLTMDYGVDMAASAAGVGVLKGATALRHTIALRGAGEIAVEEGATKTFVTLFAQGAEKTAHLTKVADEALMMGSTLQKGSMLTMQVGADYSSGVAIDTASQMARGAEFHESFKRAATNPLALIMAGAGTMGGLKNLRSKQNPSRLEADVHLNINRLSESLKDAPPASVARIEGATKRLHQKQRRLQSLFAKARPAVSLDEIAEAATQKDGIRKLARERQIFKGSQLEQIDKAATQLRSAAKALKGSFDDIGIDFTKAWKQSQELHLVPQQWKAKANTAMTQCRKSMQTLWKNIDNATPDQVRYLLIHAKDALSAAHRYLANASAGASSEGVKRYRQLEGIYQRIKAKVRNVDLRGERKAIMQKPGGAVGFMEKAGEKLKARDAAAPQHKVSPAVASAFDDLEAFGQSLSQSAEGNWRHTLQTKLDAAENAINTMKDGPGKAAAQKTLADSKDRLRPLFKDRRVSPDPKIVSQALDDVDFNQAKLTPSQLRLSVDGLRTNLKSLLAKINPKNPKNWTRTKKLGPIITKSYHLTDRFFKKIWSLRPGAKKRALQAQADQDAATLTEALNRVEPQNAQEGGRIRRMLKWVTSWKRKNQEVLKAEAPEVDGATMSTTIGGVDDAIGTYRVDTTGSVSSAPVKATSTTSQTTRINTSAIDDGGPLVPTSGTTDIDAPLVDAPSSSAGKRITTERVVTAITGLGAATYIGKDLLGGDEKSPEN